MTMIEEKKSQRQATNQLVCRYPLSGDNTFDLLTEEEQAGTLRPVNPNGQQRGPRGIKNKFSIVSIGIYQFIKKG